MAFRLLRFLFIVRKSILPEPKIDGVIRLSVPEPTEWQHIGHQIDAAMIFARANFVNVLRIGHHDPLDYRVS